MDEWHFLRLNIGQTLAKSLFLIVWHYFRGKWIGRHIFKM